MARETELFFRCDCDKLIRIEPPGLAAYSTAICDCGRAWLVLRPLIVDIHALYNNHVPAEHKHPTP